MIFLEKKIRSYLGTIMPHLFTKEYVIDPEKHFVRKGKMTLKEYIQFIFCNAGRNNDIEISDFFKTFLDRSYETMSSQAVGKQRVFIMPELFRKTHESFIDYIYPEYDRHWRVKGYIVVACDGSIFKLPNVTLTREEFNIEDDTKFKKHRIRARVSGLLDVNSGFMLTSDIVERTVKETTLAKKHLIDLENRGYDLSDFIEVYDRAYKSIDLMLFTEKMNSKFLIRLPKNTFANKRRKIKGNDKIIEINLTNSLINEFEDEDLKEYAREMGRYYLRVVEIKLENGKYVYLATNLSSDEFSVEELKELYAQRWSIETGYKKLKSQILIERFSGHRRIIIEQDFYAHMFIYNLATAIQSDGQWRMRIKKRKLDDEYIYKPLFSTIVGLIYVYMDDIFSLDYKRIKNSIEFIINQAKRLYYQKSKKLLKLEKIKGLISDYFLRLRWGNVWESKKPKRQAKDSTNDNPGNPKVTH